jgi:hypothetical protein
MDAFVTLMVGLAMMVTVDEAEAEHPKEVPVTV